MNAAKAWRLLTRPACWRGLAYGVAAAVEHAHLRALGPLATVVDVGANRGQFALIARQCFPEAQLVSFEPLPGPAATWRKLFTHDRRAELHQLAIAPAAGARIIHLSARDDSSSLLPLAELQDLTFPGSGEIGTAQIEAARLDEVISAIAKPALLKLDVQGYELEALIGCEGLLPAFTHVYAELSFIELYRGQALADRVIAHLAARDLVLRGAYNLASDRAGRAVQADFLFSRET